MINLALKAPIKDEEKEGFEPSRVYLNNLANCPINRSSIFPSYRRPIGH